MGAHWERAIDLLWQMRSLGVQPDIVSCNAVITACDRAGVWQAALSAAHGYAMSNVTCNALLSSCAVDWLRGLSLLEEMHGRSLRMDSASLCLMGSLPWAGAHSALQTMSQWQVPPDAAAWGAVASRCSETMQWQMALSLDSNTAISTCQRAGRWSETVCMTSEMRLKSQQLDLVSLSGAASAMEKAYQWQQGLGLLEFLRAHHVPLHFWSFSLLSACEKSARWRETLALATFQERAERTPVSAGDVGYAENAQISACEKAHLWVQALQLLGSTTSPDVISFSAALSSCEKAGRWQEAELLFVALSGQVLPNLITFNAAISACEKGEALRATRLWR
ncbi:Pentatricopeptide repeat-containing protein At2g31400 [Durusdinium trenchii]